MIGFDDLKSIGQTFYNAGKLKEYQAILDAQKRIFELQEENADLKLEIKTLKENDEFEKSLVYENNAYYCVNKDGIKEGPYCPVCWGGESKKIRMRSLDNDYFYCDRCKASANR